MSAAINGINRFQDAFINNLCMNITNNNCNEVGGNATSRDNHRNTENTAVNKYDNDKNGSDDDNGSRIIEDDTNITMLHAHSDCRRLSLIDAMHV